MGKPAAVKKKETEESKHVKKKITQDGWWGDITYNGNPWVKNVSRPNTLSSALNGKHLSLWQSHGRYFDITKNYWKWQRPFLFCTTEDLFTQTIVVPYLIPMLENAGAVVFTPRERDWQTEEIIVDNDSTGYTECNGIWQTSSAPGFAIPTGMIIDGYRPFEQGTVRQIATTSNSTDAPYASYQPSFSKAGRYAVYVSYATLPKSVDDVTYSVYHQGQRTDFHVNQQMGGGTWVYLGSFLFDKGTDTNNRVVVSSRSANKGIVTTDAVRFGGGMGNIGRDKTGTLANIKLLQTIDTLTISESRLKMPDIDSVAMASDTSYLTHREWYKSFLRDSIRAAIRDSVKAVLASARPKTSGLPRCLEGARYYAQWAGAPDSVYSGYDSKEDYKDDINVRSLMTNWLAGGSPYVPDRQGKHVPIDLSLAIHSDAGFNHDMKSIYGSLAICTTDFNDGNLASGLPRSHSKDFAQMLLDQSKNDITAAYGSWTWRDLYDRNYSETRLPAVPSAIFETLSHQSFPDIKLAQDPNFKFTLARSIYKTILNFEAEAHGEKAIVEPLSPVCFYTSQVSHGVSVTNDSTTVITLSWQPQHDPQEPTADATSYNIYTAMGGLGFDNGTNIQQCSYSKQITPDLPYRFRVSAVNAGGESFPSEELCVVWHSPKAKNILVVNGFTRLSSPAVIDEPGRKGLDINDDPGVSYGLTAGWSGEQKVFSTATAGKEGPGTFGYSGNELSGHFVAGNDFNYTTEHVLAIASASYNVVSCSRAAVEQGIVNLNDFDCVDIILGNEKDDGHSLMYYKTFTPELQQKLSDYQSHGKGALLISGSYIASDMQRADSILQDSTIVLVKNDSTFLANVLHCTFGGVVAGSNDNVTGLDQTFPVINSLNPDHYATTKSDILIPLASYLSPDDTFIAMQYSNGQPAAIANRNGFRTFAMGFPFECISSSAQQAVIMRSILHFLLE